MKKKLYVYPRVSKHVHDETDIYYNTVPLSEKGIKDHFILSSPETADYFYMGQISNNKFSFLSPDMYRYLEGNENRHIVDVEGEGGQPIVSWLHDCIITSMGPLKKYSHLNRLFTRPTFSHLFLDIIKNRNESFEIPAEKSFGFRGYLNHQMRAMMLHSLHNSDFKKELHMNRTWSGPSEIGGKVQHDYFLVGEDDKELDFVYRITGEDLIPSKLTEQLQAIYDTPIEELTERAEAARNYFDSVIRSYFDDPTAYFLSWLDKKGTSL